MRYYHGPVQLRLVRATAMFVRISRCAIVLLAGLLTTGLWAQAPRRITQAVTDSSAVRLGNTTHHLAIPANEAGRVAPGFPMERILLPLKSSPQQQAALDRLLAEQQDPGSPHYHQWLRPEDYGQRFGPAQEDLDAVVHWLESRGFQVTAIARGRTVIEFRGSASQVESAFHTEMHRYLAGGRSYVANSTDISIPEALAPVVAGVVSLDDFPRRPLHHVVSLPEANLSGGSHAMAPYDFAAIYDVAPLWSNGFDGAGQTIAIAGRTDIMMSDVTLFRSTFGLPGNNTQVVLNGTDPGIVSSDDQTEATLDVEWAGAVARGATVEFVVSASTSSSDGVDLSSMYIVNNNIAPVMSLSFGDCEADLGAGGNQFYAGLWSQAAAEGISVFVAAGDSGSAGCDAPMSSGRRGANTTTPAVMGFAVSGLASTPYNVAVGGTEFNDTASPSTWWNSTNDSQEASAKGYIPEVVWNESSYTTPGAAANGLWAGAGGVSAIYATPSWQTGSGVPAADPGSGGHHRYMPDVSLNGAGHDGYLIYQNGSLGLVGGTSASSPSMAGMMVLIDHYTGARNGNPNPQFYALASKAPSVYHDVTSGTNAVPCVGGSPNCSSTTASVGVMNGYSAGPGFDLATGWGSLDAYALALNWGANGTPAPAIGALSPNPMTASASPQTLTITGSSFQAGATVKVGAATFSGSLVTFVGSTQLSVSITEASAGSLAVEVTNPNNQASNTLTLQVNAPAPAIGGLSPNPMAGSNAAQTLTIAGSGFMSGLTVVIGTTSIPASQLVSVSATQVQLSIVAGTAAQSLPVHVVNPDGQTSNTVTLQVSAPAGPVIASLGSPTITHSTANQILTINGAGFQPSGVRVLLTYPGGSEQAGIIWATSTQIVALINVGNTPRTWNVQVVNANGQASNLATLTVR